MGSPADFTRAVSDQRHDAGISAGHADASAHGSRAAASFRPLIRRPAVHESTVSLKQKGATMAKIRIFKKDGTPTSYFWSSKHNGDRAYMTVYKQTPADGIKRMKGVHFNA